MRQIATGALLIPLCLVALGQDTPQPKDETCYQDKSVDKYLADLKRLKKPKATHNPLPNQVCAGAGCKDTGLGPEPQSGRAAPEMPTPREDQVSSSRDRLYNPLAAAQNVEVGDYYYGEKNYRGALMRYADAMKAKPGDAAIHLRMGRGWEKLGAPERAYLEYDAAVKLAPDGEGKTTAEAKEAMQRLKPELQKAGVDPVALVADNHPEKAPCLAPPAPTPSH